MKFGRYLIVGLGIVAAAYLGYVLAFKRASQPAPILPGAPPAESPAVVAPEETPPPVFTPGDPETAPAPESPESVAAPALDALPGDPSKAPAPDGPAPVIQLATLEYDLGVIPNDKPSKGMVAIQNKGNADLNITQVTTSCGCTTGSVESKVVPPGGETTLNVVVNPAKIYNSFEAVKHLNIWSNDPRAPHTMLKVKAQVDPEFILEPKDVQFGKVAKGETARAQLVLRQAKDTPVQVTGVKAWGAPPGLEVSYNQRPEAEWATPGRPEYVVDVSLDSNQVPPGPYKAMFAVETNIKRVRRNMCNVLAEVEAPYDIKPRPLSLGLVQPAKNPAGTLTVTSDQPVSISGVEVSGTDLTVEAQPADDGKAVNINLAVAPGATGGTKREQLSFAVKVGEATFQERIPVTAVVTLTSVLPAGPPDKAASGS